MASSIAPIDLTVEPDLQPLYPTPAQVGHLLSPNVGLSPSQKSELVSHCVLRACIFGDMSLLSFLLTDPQSQAYVDLSKQDEDGLGLISTIILGFGSESERDIEREECVRLLISEGCDVNSSDKAGWTPLHYAALLAPPTLISHLLTHGSRPLELTCRQLTPLDIVTAHSTVPGREDVALLLEEAMREEGWKGGRMEEQRRVLELRMRRIGKKRDVENDIERVLGIHPRWWGHSGYDFMPDLSDEDEDEDHEDIPLTPAPDYTTMLVFSPESLPDILESLIIRFPISMRNAEPANALYMLARFACLNCDHNWLEDLILGATDTIEDAFFNRSEDLTCLVFWLYNTTAWLHLMRCDEAISETCEYLGSFSLIEEIINSVFVFIIRFAERRIDQSLDAALLDYTPLSTEFESVQFESEWSFLRSFGGKKKAANGNTAPPVSSANTVRTTPSTTSAATTRPPSPSSPPPKGNFASLRQTLTRARAPSSATPLQSLFTESPVPPPHSPHDITSFMAALHTLLTLSGINPTLSIQLWSQVMYWTACETFNRVLTRKKYLCRSRAVQISMNISVLEEWVGEMQLPRGVVSHFAPVRDLLTWLQSLSSISEFPNLIATVQTLRNINPLQMRRAVRDYRYEVNEPRMTEECNQYLAQLQKDWERHRVKLGVEALRKEIVERDRDRDETMSLSPSMNDVSSTSDAGSMAPSQEISAAQRAIDSLFDTSQEKISWEPMRAPEPLGELMDSRFMLPLLLPSDPKLLAAMPVTKSSAEDAKSVDVRLSLDSSDRSSSRASSRTSGRMAFRLKHKKLREVGVNTLHWVDGAHSVSRWTRPLDVEEEDDKPPPPYPSDETPLEDEDAVLAPLEHLTTLTKKPSARRGRDSVGLSPIDAQPESTIV